MAIGERNEVKLRGSERFGRLRSFLKTWLVYFLYEFLENLPTETLLLP